MNCCHVVNVKSCVPPKKESLVKHTSVENMIVAMGIMPLSVHASPAGRLAHFVKNWEQLTKDRWVLSTVRGYYIDFTSTPHQSRRPHPPKFNQSQEQLIQQEVETLLMKGAVTKLRTPPMGGFYSTLFLVPKKDGGVRPVINLKQLNAFLEVPHFKMEGIQTLKSLLKRGDWLVKVDLKDAYFSIPISREHRKYLCFAVGNNTYQFNCLPFGLASAPWVFTKTLKPVAALGRELGVQLIVYIDDILLLAESEEKARVRRPGLRPGLLTAMPGVYDKRRQICTIEPAQSVEFLGFVVNAVTMELSLPAEKLKKIRAESRKLLEAGQVSARALSRLIGKMNAANQVIPPAPLFYRNLQMDLAAALRGSDQDYESSLTLSLDSKEELIWWDTRMSKWNGKSILTIEPEMVVESDASNQGWGASCQGTSTGGPWSAQERTWHINCLELLAATLALKTFAKDKRGISVLLKIDNTTAVAYNYKQSWGNSIQGTGLANTRPMDVVPGEEHSHPGTAPSRCAESYSRHGVKIHEGSIRLETESTNSMDHWKWTTNQCRRYFSWRPDPFAEAVDAFLQDWRNMKGFANPPWNLISRVLMKTQVQGAEVILVAPVWKAQPWYALLLSMLVDWPRLLPKQLARTHPESETKPLEPQLAIWSISGRDSAAKAFQAKLQTLSSNHGEQRLTSLTTHSLGDGIAGVLNGAQIHFQGLWVKLLTSWQYYSRRGISIAQ